MNKLRELARLIRYYSVRATAEAGSGHASSSLSAVDLMTVLMFGGFFRFDLKHPKYANNDRLIFSKGHASPLYYSLWLAAGALSEKKLLQFRKFSSMDMQGHPTVEFKFAEATTGSLGQGLSIGVGMALNAKYLDKSDSRTFVLLGDSEMAEGSVWEAMSIAAYYKLHNLVAIADVNRLGQRGETMHGHDTAAYAKKAQAFGWDAIMIDGHDIAEIQKAFAKALASKNKPVLVVAKTLKGKGIPMIEDREGWHGKPISKEEMEKALAELGPVNKKIRGELGRPRALKKVPVVKAKTPETSSYSHEKPVATRRAYGNALVHLGAADPNIVVLDAETSNSTYAEFFKNKFPKRFFEMFIAEQNMVGAAQGLSRRGKIPFVSTFAAFLTRAFDQIRMGSYSNSNVKFCGSHAGVSIGEDGVSQMGLEDLAMFRSIFGAVVVYPSDAPSTEALMREIAKHKGICYIRTTRKETPVMYSASEKFPIGGSKALRTSPGDIATVVAAGVTVSEAIKAYEELKAMGTNIRVIDLYSIQPLDVKTLVKAAKETGAIITVEDHYPQGGLGEAVASALADAGVSCRMTRLAVRKMPRSGKPDELLDFEGINARAIVQHVKRIPKTKHTARN